MIRAINRVRLPVVDPERSAAFYERLGFQRLDVREQDAHDTGDAAQDTVRLAFADSLRLELVRHIPTADRIYICFEVADIQETYSCLLEQGVMFRSLPVAIDSSLFRGGFAVYFADPDGYTLELFQSSSQAAPTAATSIYHIGLYVGEMEPSLRFYMDLGFLLESYRLEFREDYFRKIVCLPDASVHVAILRAPAGPRLTLMEYVVPRRVRKDGAQRDIGGVQLHLLVGRAGKNGTSPADGCHQDASLCDPDGFILKLQYCQRIRLEKKREVD